MTLANQHAASHKLFRRKRDLGREVTWPRPNSWEVTMLLPIWQTPAPPFPPDADEERDRDRTPTHPPAFFILCIPYSRAWDRASFQAGVGRSKPGCFLPSTWQKSLSVVLHTEAILQRRRNGRLPVHPKLRRTLCVRLREAGLSAKHPPVQPLEPWTTGFVSPSNSTQEATEGSGEQFSSPGCSRNHDTIRVQLPQPIHPSCPIK